MMNAKSNLNIKSYLKQKKPANCKLLPSKNQCLMFKLILLSTRSLFKTSMIKLYSYNNNNSKKSRDCKMKQQLSLID